MDKDLRINSLPFASSRRTFVAGTTAKLGRGRLWNQSGVTCHVALTTVMCFNGANHGFVIGNGHYRTF